MLASVKRLSSAKRDEVIRQVCDRNAQVEVMCERENRSAKYSSRFYQAGLKGSEMRLLVEMPREDGQPVRFGDFEEVEAMFSLGGERYAFTSFVEGRCLYTLAGGQKAPALVLSYPVTLESRQRRAHYRVPVEISSQVSVAFVEYTGTDLRVGDANIYAGVISDISAGGLAMLVRQRLPASIAAGTRLQVSFQLPGEPEHLSLKAVVRNMRDADEHTTRVCGIEFTTEAQDIQARQFINLIQRGVVKRQREILKKLRML